MYLDDWLLNQSSAFCLKDTQELVHLAIHLGFNVNPAKSDLVPSI